jgi:UDP-glucose 6-dehydrogenase
MRISVIGTGYVGSVTGVIRLYMKRRMTLHTYIWESSLIR